jgi:hypothetical protein
VQRADATAHRPGQGRVAKLRFVLHVLHEAYYRQNLLPRMATFPPPPPLRGREPEQSEGGRGAQPFPILSHRPCEPFGGNRARL